MENQKITTRDIPSSTYVTCENSHLSHLVMKFHSSQGLPPDCRGCQPPPFTINLKIFSILCDPHISELILEPNAQKIAKQRMAHSTAGGGITRSCLLGESHFKSQILPVKNSNLQSSFLVGSRSKMVGWLA